MAQQQPQRRFVFLDATDVFIEQKVLEGLCHVEGLGLEKVEDIPDWVAGVEYIGLWHTIKLKEQDLKKLKACKVIIRMGVGYDNVDIDAAGRLGIAVCNIPAYGTEEVADTTLALILSLFRQTAFVNIKVRDGLVVRGAEQTLKEAPFARRLRGAILGIIGLGAIGSAVAMRANALGMKVIFFDPYVSDGTAKALNVIRVEDLHELARTSNCISVNCLLNDETRNMINAAFMSEMPQGSFIVNAGRGGIIDEKALYDALVSGHLGGCGLDVVEHEPVTRDNPLVGLPNSIITPHIAWFSQESLVEMRQTAASVVRRAIEGKDLRNVVNKAKLSRHPSDSSSK